MNTHPTYRIAQVIGASGESCEPIFRERPDCAEAGLVALLKECRMQLPLAAASWNNDENPVVAAFHVPRVLDLLGRVSAAIAAAGVAA